MKYLISILAFTLFLNADYLYTKNNHCVIDLVPYPDNSGLCWHDQHNNNDYCKEKAKYSDFKDGYSYIDGSCQYKNDLSVTGLTQSEWDYMLAFLANLVGFTMLFMVTFLSVLIARK